MMNRLRNFHALDPADWRGGMLALMLKVAAILGVIVCIPSVYLAVKNGIYEIVLLDAVAIGVVFALNFLTGLSFRVRAVAFGLVCYVLGTGLLYLVGARSQIYLMGSSVFVTLLLGTRAGLFAVLLTSVTLLGMGLTGNVANDISTTPASNQPAGWWLITLNFTLISYIVVAGVGVALRAIERARENEAELRRAQEGDRQLLRTLFDTLPDAVFTKDLLGAYTQANRATVQQSGHSSLETLLGRTVFDLYPRDIAEAITRDDLVVIAGGLISDREVPLTTPDGLKRWLLSLKAPLRDGAGNIIGVVGVTRDITDRKQAEFERDRHLHQLEVQIERMPLAYMLADREFRCIRWNPAAERMFGYAPHEVLSEPIFDFIIPEASQPQAVKILDRIRRGQMDVAGEFVNVTKSGASITCEWHNTPMFDDEGKFAGVLSLVSDITVRKKLESQLLQSQKMEAIGQLAGGVAHDFNNLLTVIFGYSELVIADPNAGTDTRTSVQAINQAAQRAAGLTGQLLAFSRKSMLQPKVLDINAVVTETGAMLRRLIGEDVALNTTLESRLNLVRFDPGQLTQVLMNLSVNARDAMPRGGTLSIETQNVELSEEYANTNAECRPGPHVMLAITDTGVGMTPEVLAHIFEPFYTTKEVGSGTGLGLATVFGIVRQSGGTITVYSEPGIGTTFKLYFPSLTSAVAMEGGAVAPTAQGGSETVLLVEDDDAVRRLAAASLRRFGYEVLAASSGDEALRLAAVHPETIRVMLTDVVMPGMSGPNLVLAMRERFPHIRVVFMSGYTDDAVVRHGLLAAEVLFLQKPFTPAGLALKIRQVLDS